MRLVTFTSLNRPDHDRRDFARSKIAVRNPERSPASDPSAPVLAKYRKSGKTSG
ncbi:hypothetical protein J2Z21_002459 [Streptomyces griseochromogenes]|uniref:Transposase n=1 Tax=Streptomyces griseochromogenes TaxID=68214 RepID=A0ABS4LQA0_9ACTN|nr:hypothetical protein [Streptomyces griseochromogenes]